LLARASFVVNFAKNNMVRIKIDLPAQFPFETQMEVRIYDLNYGAHLGNDRMLSLFHETRARFFKALGIENEKDGLGGYGVIMTDAAVVYKAESFYGDHLTIRAAAADVTEKTMDILYQVVNSETKKEIARGKTGLVCFDYSQRKLASIPERFLEKLKEFARP